MNLEIGQLFLLLSAIFSTNVSCNAFVPQFDSKVLQSPSKQPPTESNVSNIVKNENDLQQDSKLVETTERKKNSVPISHIKTIPQQGTPLPKNALGSIAQSVECASDVQRVCSNKNPNNNFDILYCLTNNQDNHQISDECHHYIWNFKFNITTNPEFVMVARKVCKQQIEILSECASVRVPDVLICLVTFKDRLTEPGCINFITKVQTIIFSDFRLLFTFAKDCKNDIWRLKCGRAGETLVLDEEMPHSQGGVIDCLEREYRNRGILAPQCRKEITRLAELSADDYHLDRHLYFKCKDDREKLCPDVVSGQGMVYKCLFEHKFDQQMSHGCREALTSRQKLVAEDYRASYGLAHHCKDAIQWNHCDAGRKTDHDTVSLASIMLCLENKNLNRVPISPACDDELIEYRRMIMDDYELSPEIVHGCAKEIETNCHGGLEKEGKTLHCLLALERNGNKVSSLCEHALMDLIKETEVAQDYRMDAVLTRACQPVIRAKCNDLHSGDPMILSCLMDSLYSWPMRESCRKSLLDIQYFVSRNFLLDPIFRRHCKNDAARFCTAPRISMEDEDDNNQVDPVPFSMVLSCLYRHIPSSLGFDDMEMVGRGLSSECESEVHRVIKQRALDVNLNPDLEKSCRKELGQFCSDKVHEKTTGFSCLQDNYDKLQPGDCRKQIKKLTQLMSQNTLDFNSIVMKECERMVEKYCYNLLDQEDEGEIMECLIDNKEDMESAACAAGVTHFQLIEMKDYTFSYKFLKACQKDVNMHCSFDNIKTKADVVRCLTLKIRNAVIGGTDITVSSQCREQLFVERREMHKNIEMNPRLKSKCSEDRRKFCSHVKSGKAQVIKCLREHKYDLMSKCYKALFIFVEEEVDSPNLDFQLMRSCKSDIKEHCKESLANGDTQLVVECLIKKKKDLVKTCLLVVIKREKEMFSDISLNADLMNSCGGDIKRLCSDAMAKAMKAHDKGKDPEGIVYKCLKEKFISKSKKDALSMVCYRHVEFVLVEQEQNYELDPQLTLHCYKSIQSLCYRDDRNNVVECLKGKYFENMLFRDPECEVEVARLLAEGQSDIMADPALHQACSNDLTKYCHLVSEGHGRLITCLVDVASRDKSLLSSDCFEELELRTKMWKMATRKSVKDFGELSNIVIVSHHSYLLPLLAMTAVLVLLLGAACVQHKKVANMFFQLKGNVIKFALEKDTQSTATPSPAGNANKHKTGVPETDVSCKNKIQTKSIEGPSEKTPLLQNDDDHNYDYETSIGVQAEDQSVTSTQHQAGCQQEHNPSHEDHSKQGNLVVL